MSFECSPGLADVPAVPLLLWCLGFLVDEDLVVSFEIPGSELPFPGWPATPG